ncbi:hypothetical protein BU17DRAFT_47444, partial [Hysterangium stoloniferum]
PNMSTFLSSSKPTISTPGTNDFGLKQLAPGGESSNVDIVAIHGLDGHREASFNADNGVLWLRDLLPETLPSARILTYGYDARTHGENRSQQTMYDVAVDLVAKLFAFRINTSTGERPLIFIAHSFGGIILKNALIHASTAHMGHLGNHKAVEISTYGVIFMGTPHQGVEWTRTHVDGRSLESLQLEPLLKHLLSHSEALQQQLTQYNSISARFKTVFCYEVYATPVLMGNQCIPASSAIVPGTVNADYLAIHKTHSEMVKFQSKGDGDYNNMVFQLQQMSETAPSHIALNWMKHSNFLPYTSGREVMDPGNFELAPVNKRCVKKMSKDMIDLCKKISDWVAAPDPSENYFAAQRLRTKGTGTWFTTSAEFTQWKNGAKPCLWIYGSSEWIIEVSLFTHPECTVGSGKSILW